MLAMDVNDYAFCQNERVAWTFFASKLAPTVLRSELSSRAQNGLACSPGVEAFLKLFAVIDPERGIH